MKVREIASALATTPDTVRYYTRLQLITPAKSDNGYKFYSTKDSSETAWTDNDEKVVYAMKKGLELTLTGESTRGTITNDVYTLKGFTSAINQLNEECK